MWIQKKETEPTAWYTVKAVTEFSQKRMWCFVCVKGWEAGVEMGRMLRIH